MREYFIFKQLSNNKFNVIFKKNIQMNKKDKRNTKSLVYLWYKTKQMAKLINSINFNQLSFIMYKAK